MKKEEYLLRAVIFQQNTEGETWWVAQSIDHDISGQAKRMPDAIQELTRMVVIQICASRENGLEPFKGLPKPPEKFRMMFREGLRLAEKPEIKVPESLPYFRPRPELSVYA